MRRRTFRGPTTRTALRAHGLLPPGLLALWMMPLWTMAPSTAAAEPLPVEATVQLGRPARAVTVRLSAGEAVTLTATSGGRRVREEMPVRGLADAEVSVLDLGGTAVAIVRGTGEEGALAAVVALRDGAPVVLWSGRTDLHGDPGERTAAALSTEDRTGDGQPDLVVGLRREGTSLCGQPETILQPRAFDPARSEMRPVVLSRVSPDGATAVTATRQSPGPTGPPLVRALQLIGASSRSGAGETVDALGPPRALGDGSVETFWAEGRGGPGRGEFVVGQWGTRLPIRAIALTVSPSGEAAARLGRPRTLWITGDSGAPLRVVIPEDAASHPGERYWVVPPSPLPWRCVSVVLDEAFAPTGARESEVHTGLAEVEIFTDLDFGDGVEGLVAMLVEGGRQGDEAARLLAGLGAVSVAPVAAAWERLDGQGRRRAVRVLAIAARDGSEDAVDALARAATDDEEEVRRSALEALGTLGERAGELLAQLALAPAPLGEEAVRSLLRHEPRIVVPALLAALDAEGGAERPAVREGLAQAIAAADEEAVRPFSAWVAADPPIAGLASAVLGLAEQPATHALAARLLSTTVGRVESFSDRWRTVRAALRLSADPEVDAWLASLAADAEEWMLRAAAVEALGRRGSERRLEVARAALSDEYPRVRVQAIALLDAADEDDEAIAQRIEGDSWPMVREAAVSALWDRPDARRAVRRAVRDNSPRVRRASIVALTRAGDRGAWPLVEARLEDDDEWPQVSVAALEYVRDLCVQDAGEAVLGVVERGMQPDAWAPDVDVAAAAIDLALVLGGETAERALVLSRRPDAPPPVQLAVTRRQADPVQCTPGSGPAGENGDETSEGDVPIEESPATASP